MTVQFSMWDKFKEMEKTPKESRSKLASFLSHLLLTKSLSISVFKVITQVLRLYFLCENFCIVGLFPFPLSLSTVIIDVC